MLRHPWVLGGSQRQAHGKIRNAYLNLAVSGAQKRAEMLRHPCNLGGLSTPSTGSKIRSGCLAPILSGTKIGRKCNVTPEFSGVHNAKGMEENPKWLSHPCLLGCPK